jgi:hypothetical protein
MASVSTADEVRLYAGLLWNNMFGPKYDLLKIPGPSGYWLWGARAAGRGPSDGPTGSSPMPAAETAAAAAAAAVAVIAVHCRLLLLSLHRIS